MLAAAYEVTLLESGGLFLRPRAASGRLAVLVVDPPLTAWWDARVAEDPARAAARLLSALAEADPEARATERYRILEGERLVPSMRARRPALRDTSPPTSGGRWVAYVPVDPG